MITYRFPGIHSKLLIRSIRSFGDEYADVSNPGINKAAQILEAEGCLNRERLGRHYNHTLTNRGISAARQLARLTKIGE